MNDSQPQQQPQKRKRQRVDSSTPSDPSTTITTKIDKRNNNSRIRIPASCATGLAQITQELGLRSNGEAIHWLLQQSRPELVSPLPNKPPVGSKKTATPKLNTTDNNSNSNSTNVLVPNPVAFAYSEDGGNGKINALIPVGENGGDGEFMLGGDDDEEVEEEEEEGDAFMGDHCRGPRPTVRATVVQASTVFYDTPATLGIVLFSFCFSLFVGLSIPCVLTLNQCDHHLLKSKVLCYHQDSGVVGLDDKAERLIAGAAAYGSQLVVFPEAFVGGYPRFINFDITDANHPIEEYEEFRKYHTAAIDVPGPEVDRLAAICLKYKVHLVMGVVERVGVTLYSTLLFFDSQGQCLGKNRKLIPTASEHMIWQSGEKATPPVYKTSVGMIGGLACWDNRMPPLRTELYSEGVEIYCAPTADARDAWKASMTHIAVEGGCFVLSANQFCQRKDYPLRPVNDSRDTNGDLSPDSVVCSGGSVIISPSGAVLAGPNCQGESLISADLDLDEITQAKLEYDVVRHAASLGLNRKLVSSVSFVKNEDFFLVNYNLDIEAGFCWFQQ
ncbi:hypothetical protein IFM89_004125, partial [Coptis chinensis]